MKEINSSVMALSVGEAAVRLGVSENLVRQAVKKGVIQSVRFGSKRILIPMSEIEKLLNVELEVP